MPTPEIIELTIEEQWTAIREGWRRDRIQAEEIAKHGDWHQNDRRNVEGDLVTASVIGVLGEIAMCKRFGLEWIAGAFYGPDTKEGVESRARRVPGQGPDLGFNEKDRKKERYPYVLSHVDRDCISHPKVMGWLYGFEGMRKLFWRPAKGYKKGICFVAPELLHDNRLLEARLSAGLIKWDGPTDGDIRHAIEAISTERNRHDSGVAAPPAEASSATPDRGRENGDRIEHLRHGERTQQEGGVLRPVSEPHQPNVAGVRTDWTARI